MRIEMSFNGARSVHEHTAVDLDRLTGEIAGRVGGQKANDFANFTRRTNSAQRNHARICLHHLWRRKLFVVRSVNHSWGDGVYAHSEWCQLFGQTLGKSDQPTLRRRLMDRAQGPAIASGNRRDVDDRTG